MKRVSGFIFSIIICIASLAQPAFAQEAELYFAVILQTENGSAYFVSADGQIAFTDEADHEGADEEFKSIQKTSQNFSKGETVAICALPDEGYKVKDISVKKMHKNPDDGNEYKGIVEAWDISKDIVVAEAWDIGKNIVETIDEESIKDIIKIQEKNISVAVGEDEDNDTDRKSEPEERTNLSEEKIYSFIMPESDVQITVDFVPVSDKAEDSDSANNANVDDSSTEQTDDEGSSATETDNDKQAEGAASIGADIIAEEEADTLKKEKDAGEKSEEQKDKAARQSDEENGEKNSSIKKAAKEESQDTSEKEAEKPTTQAQTVKKADAKAVAIKTIKFDKTEIELATKEKLSLNTTISPKEATNDILWKSSDVKIVSVDSKGKITANRYGTATVTAYSKANPKINAEIRVSTRFCDVNDKTRYYYIPVYWAAGKNITEGYDNVYFGPAQKCTRLEMMIFLWRYAGKPEVNAKIPFKDIKFKTSSDSYKAVKWGAGKGIIKGYGDGTFRPDASITRKDTMIMLYRLSGKPMVSGSISFKDVVAQKYSKTCDTYKAILWGTNTGVTKGYTDGNFKPFSDCLREHIVTFLYRYNNVKNSGYGTGAYNINGTWKYYENGVFRPSTGLIKRVTDGKWIYVYKGVFKKLSGFAKKIANSDDKYHYILRGEMVGDSSNTYTVSNILLKLNEKSRRNNAAWAKVVDYWNKINEGGFTNTKTVPENLPNDKSLCICVMGFQLYDNGSMQPELVSRLNAALKIAKKYPKCYILVAGGGTASNSNATEAGKMAEWLKKKGIAAGRIITEASSLSTIENAVYSYNIMKKKYPGINKVVMVTSDYHLPVSCLLYEARFVLQGAKDGRKDAVDVVANYGNYTGSNSYYNLATQAAWLWKLESY